MVDITINDPNPFTVFVGPNGSGKSNIFEALELMGLSFSKLFVEGEVQIESSTDRIFSLFGGINQIKNFKVLGQIQIIIRDENENFLKINEENSSFNISVSRNLKSKVDLMDYLREFNRIFIKNKDKQKINFIDDSKLSFSCDNLEKVLKRILQNPVLREEILDYLRMLVPELENIEIITDEIDGDTKLRIYEKYSKKPFNKALISDGTYNILCLLAAVYQSDEPQFLCIEEPENGLSPYAIETLVGLFRSHCKDYGHYIWLNTHSQTLVRNLRPEEFILVDKIEGETKIKQYKADDLEGWRMDEAWLTNALGGGLPW